jgi:hypothetical protein
MADTTQHICRVGTARLGYQGRVGQRVLNTTVKSGSGLGAVFAPTWNMVMAFKQGSITWDTYREQYTTLMRQRYQANPSAFLEVLSSDELILCCYCTDTHTTMKHCHRYLLVEILEKIAARYGIGFEALGEVDGSAMNLSCAAPQLHTLIAGSRYASREALYYARRVVRRVHQLGHTIIVGDNPKGVDMAVVQECRRLKANVLVVGVTHRPRNGGCSHDGYVKVEQDTYRAAGGHLFDRYHVRDRWMVDNAQRGVFIWNGDSSGTKAGYEYMVSRQKEAHLVTFALKGARHG